MFRETGIYRIVSNDMVEDLDVEERSSAKNATKNVYGHGLGHQNIKS
jgi:hypothetical protein